jgi:hypothetical protein
MTGRHITPISLHCPYSKYYHKERSQIGPVSQDKLQYWRVSVELVVKENWTPFEDVRFYRQLTDQSISMWQANVHLLWTCITLYCLYYCWGKAYWHRKAIYFIHCFDLHSSWIPASTIFNVALWVVDVGYGRWLLLQFDQRAQRIISRAPLTCKGEIPLTCKGKGEKFPRM